MNTDHYFKKETKYNLCDHEEPDEEGHDGDEQQKQFTPMTGEEVGWVQVWYGRDQALQTHKLWTKNVIKETNITSDQKGHG